MDKIYNKMIINNTDKIITYGFNYDPLLKCMKDDRYCWAIFCDYHDVNFTPKFYELQNLLKNTSGITYVVSNENPETQGTLHFTFMQQISFKDFYHLEPNIINKCYEILESIIKPHLPFVITFDRLIAVPNGLILCGDSPIKINSLRELYRKELIVNNLPLMEPYNLDIIHSTLFRFTDEPDASYFFSLYNEFLNKKIPFGQVTITHFNLGNTTWKVNKNEIIIQKTIKI